MPNGTAQGGNRPSRGKSGHQDHSVGCRDAGWETALPTEFRVEFRVTSAEMSFPIKADQIIETQ
ncbi:hypothetical protein Vau01_121770 [Virgisporangium aurantiacum]|uniref:Uncharacterized protein n=1 Tax=Virgisporangium aurantiacum TaxID=175570 RepID=A0A8J4E7K8_9ACTN|nr:hypothetical protein Vau01_121770 [Virgisporangium aurantiacum]